LEIIDCKRIQFCNDYCYHHRKSVGHPFILKSKDLKQKEKQEANKNKKSSTPAPTDEELKLLAEYQSRITQLSMSRIEDNAEDDDDDKEEAPPLQAALEPSASASFPAPNQTGNSKVYHS
jgi:ribosome-binding protein aMBF1 (putative translation factor)